MLREDVVVAATKKDLIAAVELIRQAIAREDRELGADGLGTRLSLIVDELLTWA